MVSKKEDYEWDMFGMLSSANFQESWASLPIGDAATACPLKKCYLLAWNGESFASLEINQGESFFPLLNG